MLLIAQCNALHAAMPFLFERIDDETELLLPDNLLHSDSLIRKLVNGIDEEDWQEVEIIGWLYQFYISEKKDQVIGKVVKSEDIPAATQLFTPNWIVKYLVQNSLGRQWMATYPNSPLKQQMAYYIEPAEQTPEVQAQLTAITPESLNPEELTLLDPACGSGHILVEAYDLFKAIYQERGYRARDIPSLILQKNLYGLEIDDRAAQLAAFALMMKARADDRRIFSSGVQPHVLAIQESQGLDVKKITETLNVPIEQGKKIDLSGDIAQADIAHLINLFEHGKTFGSLIRVPNELAEKLSAIAKRLKETLGNGDMFSQPILRVVQPIVEQARILSGKYAAVVANPPYLNSSAMDSRLKVFVSEKFPDTKSDLFSVFIERNCELAMPTGFIGFMTPFVWMFLKSYERLRELVVEKKSINSLVHPEYHAFFDSAYVPICSFVLRNCLVEETGEYFDLSRFYGAELQPVKFREALDNPNCGWRYSMPSHEFVKIPGRPIAYWVSNRIHKVFTESKLLSELARIGKGLDTGDNELFLRLWHEVDADMDYWHPCLKGGPFRKWYGNNTYLINWQDNGKVLRDFPKSNLRNADCYFLPGITWTRVSSSSTAFRYFGSGFVFESTGPCIFSKHCDDNILIAFLNSNVVSYLLRIIAPTLDFQSGHISSLPIISGFSDLTDAKAISTKCVEIARADWDSSETSWDFGELPMLKAKLRAGTVKGAHDAWKCLCQERIDEMQQLEEKSNQLFIEAYGLQDEIFPEVPREQITLYRPNREEDTRRLLSYAIGCMMGRYSLDKPGLIYAHSGNKDFSCSQYQTFPADEDGIIPITETNWFPDDASNRLVEFISVAWPKEHLEENRKSSPTALARTATSSLVTLFAAILPRASTSTTCQCTSADRFTGFFPAANNELSSVSSPCIATTKAPCHGCAPSTSFRSRGRWLHAWTNCQTTLLRLAQRHIVRGCRRNRIHFASNTRSCRPLTSSSATTPTGVSASTWMTG
jgi:hypothetical protein